MLSKTGTAVESLDAAAIDAALASLSTSMSIEQRIAVKAELLRSGLIS